MSNETKNIIDLPTAILELTGKKPEIVLMMDGTSEKEVVIQKISIKEARTLAEQLYTAIDIINGHKRTTP